MDIVNNPKRYNHTNNLAMRGIAQNFYFKTSDFLSNFGHKTLNSGHVMWSRDVILGGVVQFTMLVLLNKEFLGP
jgi:hypothetical protein